MTHAAIAPGDLFSFPDGHGHCRHGILLAKQDCNGKIYLVDTYWVGLSGSGTGWTQEWTPEEIAGRVTFIINVQDCRSTNREIYDRYADQDRAYIPAGGCGEFYLVRRGAQPDAERWREQLEYAVEWAKAELRAAEWGLAFAEANLRDLITVQRRASTPVEAPSTSVDAAPGAAC